MEYYHGTANVNAQKIIKSQRFRSDLQIIDSILWEGNRQKIKIPGSLGYGTYTFVNDPKLALMFAKKENEDPVVLQVFIKTVDDDNLLDLTEADSQEQFQKFSGYLRNSQKAQEIFKAFTFKRRKKSNIDSHNVEDDNSPRDVYAGIMTELFIAFLKKEGCRVKYVKKHTETLLPPNGYGYQRLGLPNGTEFTIRHPNDVANIQKYSFKEEA